MRVDSEEGKTFSSPMALNVREKQSIDEIFYLINALASHFCSIESVSGMERAGIAMARAMIPSCYAEKEEILEKIIGVSSALWQKKPFHQENPPLEDVQAVIDSLPFIGDSPVKGRVSEVLRECVELKDCELMFIIDCLIWSLINYIATKRRPELKDGIHQPTVPFMKHIKLGEILKESGRKRISLSEL